MFQRRRRQVRIIATLGPASSSPAQLRRLFDAGADVFRLNMSHGSHAEHSERLHALRELEAELKRPIGVLLDLQGPKLRLGRFQAGRIQVREGQSFQLDLDPTAGDEQRVCVPHPEIFAIVQPGHLLLIDDGRVRLQVQRADADRIHTLVQVGGELSDRKGLNVPDAVLPISAVTEKDKADLAFGLELGVDWVALSFVQTADDIRGLRELVGHRAAIMAKLEKPAALEHLEAIVQLADGAMVARGDLGVELRPEDVPSAQRRIVRECRRQGKPVVVATQMLDSMVQHPTPTRAEASDVASAVYDGVDAVMLSAETASGRYPVESVAMMDRIARKVEADPHYRKQLHADHLQPEAPQLADAISAGIRAITELLPMSVTAAYTSSGSTTLSIARERAATPILSLSPRIETARRLTLAWGVHSICMDDVASVEEMVDRTLSAAREEGLAEPGHPVLMVAGMPFGTPGATNLLRVAWPDASPSKLSWSH